MIHINWIVIELRHTCITYDDLSYAFYGDKGHDHKKEREKKYVTSFL